MKKSIVSPIQILVLCFVVMISTWTLAYGQNQDLRQKLRPC
jgi:hypothetical protein